MRGWRQQLVVLLLAGALFAAHPEPDTLGVVGAYLAAWLIANLARAFAPKLFDIELTRPQAALLVLTLASAPVARAIDLWPRFLITERFEGIEHRLESRRWIEQTPAIFPPLLAAGRPQTFYVNAPGASAVVARVGGAESPEVIATSLGHGLFRLALDPRELDLPGRATRVAVELLVDGVSHERDMRFERRLPHPRWLHASADRRRVVTVSEETDTAYVIDRDARARTIPTRDGPVDAFFEGDPRHPGAIVIAHRYARGLLYVGEHEERWLDIACAAVRMAVEGDTTAVACEGERPELVVIRDRTVRRRVPLAFTPDWIALTADHIVLSSRIPAALHRFERDGSPSSVEPLQLGRPTVTMTAANGVVIAAVTDLHTDGPPHLGNHFVRDQLVSVDVARWRVIGARLTGDRTPRQGAPGDLDRGISPMGIDIAPDGSWWVAFAGSDDVCRYREGALPRRFDTEDHPLATPISAVALDGGRFAVSSAIYGAVGVFSANGELMRLTRFAPGDDELLANDQHALQMRIGERGFFEGTRSGVSCQSCHPGEGSDQTVHNIGDSTLIATLDTRGLYGTPPYLRDGGFPMIGSFDELADLLYRGFLRHQPGRRISLDGYVSSLPRPTPYRQLTGRDDTRERRGLDAFVRARCPVCHAFPAFTNLSQHPAATLFGRAQADALGSAELDVPTLLGLDQSAPYLLDGRARTLREVFADHDPVERHGDLAALDDAALDDLLYLLEGL